uniref:Uncharacterized protein n=1 Tax=Compsopogon caeruleus TaxID=31354 RepID=A0A7S1XAN9_9RHOD
MNTQAPSNLQGTQYHLMDRILPYHIQKHRLAIYDPPRHQTLLLSNLIRFTEGHRPSSTTHGNMLIPSRRATRGPDTSVLWCRGVGMTTCPSLSLSNFITVLHEKKDSLLKWSNNDPYVMDEPTHDNRTTSSM